MLRTGDGGRSWNSTTLSVLDWEAASLRLDFVSPARGGLLATSGPGGGQMLKSFFTSADGGKTWRPQNLAHPEAYRDSRYGNAFPLLFFGPERREGVLLVELVGPQHVVVPYLTHDGGASWQGSGGETVSGIPNPYARFFDFADPQHGWVLDAGSSRLALTEDGGRHWTAVLLQVPVQSAEPHFVSARDGWVLDRESGRLWHTGDGGRTWTEINPTAAA